jgi:hypothetical protein
MYKKHILLVLLMHSIWTKVIQAQETISSAGENTIGSAGAISYTIGQTSYLTISGVKGTINQGVQQPFEIFVVTAIENTSEISIEFKVYPNPTRGQIKLMVGSSYRDKIRFRLYDINGTLLQDNKVENIETEISMENLSSSFYILKLINSHNQELKVFKIVKN